MGQKPQVFYYLQEERNFEISMIWMYSSLFRYVVKKYHIDGIVVISYALFVSPEKTRRTVQ